MSVSLVGGVRGLSRKEGEKMADEERYDGEYEEKVEGREEVYEEYVLTETPWWMRKAVPLLGSLGFHGVLAWIFTFCLMGVAQLKVEAATFIKTEFMPQQYNPELKRDIFPTPRIECDKMVEHPILPLEEEMAIAKEIPLGTSFENLSTKNLESTSCVDANGLGGGRAGAYGQRSGKGMLPNEGGSPGTESAVTAALRWLYFHQDPNGMWDQDGFDKNCDPKKPPKCDNPNFLSAVSNQHDVGVSALALLAFLGNGHTHRGGQFGRTVQKGLEWLKSQQQSDGSFGSHIAESWMYNHALATLAICEAYAVTRDPRLQRPAQDAVNFIRNAQNPGLGWKYEPRDGKCDTSVTGWIVLALKAAYIAKLEVPKELFDGAIAWFERATDPAGKTGYMKPGDDGSVIRGVNEGFAKLPTMTSVGVICRIFCGQPRESRVLRDGVDILMANLPEWNKPKNDKVDFYYWYYGTYAMFQYGGEKWYKWNKAMKEALLDTQRVGGCADGSWDPIDKWGMVGGRVYATALNCLTLEIYYRYARTVSAITAPVGK